MHAVKRVLVSCLAVIGVIIFGFPFFGGGVKQRTFVSCVFSRRRVWASVF